MQGSRAQYAVKIPSADNPKAELWPYSSAEKARCQLRYWRSKNIHIQTSNKCLKHRINQKFLRGVCIHFISLYYHEISYFIMETCLRDNIWEFKAGSQPVFHLYSSNFSLQIIVAAHSMSAVFGTSGTPLAMTALKQQQCIQNHKLQKIFWSITSLFSVLFKKERFSCLRPEHWREDEVILD